MLGLRPFAQQQDENALAGLHRPAALKGGAAAAGEGGLAARKGAPTPGFPRKALGNITNTAGGRGLDAENAPPGKTPAGGAPAPARRALGDITNAGGAPGLHRASGLKPQQAAQQAALAACAPTVADAPASRADVLAEGGVERAHGRGWEALEAARVAREDEESQRRLAALANFPSRGLPNFFPLWVRSRLGWRACWGDGAALTSCRSWYVARQRARGVVHLPCAHAVRALQGAPAGISQQQVLQKDVLPPLPASPVAKRQPSFAGGQARARGPQAGCRHVEPGWVVAGLGHPAVSAATS